MKHNYLAFDFGLVIALLGNFLSFLSSLNKYSKFSVLIPENRGHNLYYPRALVTN
jgi:hypothetical protein